MKSSLADFNKEIVLGECGALLFANVFAYLTSLLTADSALISLSAVIGTLAGGSAFWLAARAYSKRHSRESKTRALARDVAYFTPAAVAFSFLVYDPVIYLVARYFLDKGLSVELSVIIGQAAAFSLFLSCMNLYRVVLFKVKGKAL